MSFLSLVATALLAAVLCGCAAPSSRTQAGLPPAFVKPRMKEVLCVVEPLPNYITHLTAVAGLPWPSEYAQAYGHTVDLEGHQILRRHAPMLQWGQGITGDLTPFFVLLPAYLPLDDEFDLFEYMRAVDQAMDAGNYAPIGDLYPREHARLAWWMFDFEGFFYSRAEIYQTYLRAVRQLAHVYEHNFQAWDEQVWHDVELDLDLAAADLNGDLWTLDLLQTLERLTQERFRGDRYEIVLTAAPAGSGITSLGYHRSMLSVGEDRERMLGLIVHEVGTHLLVDVYRDMLDRDLSEGELDWATAAAYAGLTTHYTRQIIPQFETEIENDVEIFAGIFRQLADEEPRAGARRLMRRALDEHRSGRW